MPFRSHRFLIAEKMRLKFLLLFFVIFGLLCDFTLAGKDSRKKSRNKNRNEDEQEEGDGEHIEMTSLATLVEANSKRRKRAAYWNISS